MGTDQKDDPFLATLLSIFHTKKSGKLTWLLLTLANHNVGGSKGKHLFMKFPLSNRYMGKFSYLRAAQIYSIRLHLVNPLKVNTPAIFSPLHHIERKVLCNHLINPHYANRRSRTCYRSRNTVLYTSSIRQVSILCQIAKRVYRRACY